MGDRDEPSPPPCPPPDIGRFIRSRLHDSERRCDDKACQHPHIKVNSRTHEPQKLTGVTEFSDFRGGQVERTGSERLSLTSSDIRDGPAPPSMLPRMRKNT
jgi:hypothetical protein